MNKRLSEHREELKQTLLSRDSYCPGCGVGLVPDVNVHMHEAFIRKSTMVGLSVDDKIKLNCKENCALVCMDCNLNEPFLFRAKIWQRHCELYGHANMVLWYESANERFKNPLQEFWRV